MRESVLNALIHLFALVAAVNKEGVSNKGFGIVQSILGRYLISQQLEKYMSLFKELLKYYRNELDLVDEGNKKEFHFFSFQAKNVSGQIKKDLTQEERFVVFVQLFEFVNEDNLITPAEEVLLRYVANTFHISDTEMAEIGNFVLEKEPDHFSSDHILFCCKGQGEKFLLASRQKTNQVPRKNKLRQDYNFSGTLVFFSVKTIDVCFLKYYGSDKLTLNSKYLHPGEIYPFREGSVIKNDIGETEAIYYTDVIAAFHDRQEKEKVLFCGEKVSFKYKKSGLGIAPFSFAETGGALIGIIGGSGSGKSTLLTLLNGKKNPSSGAVKLNGYDVHENLFRLRGIIGYVPQDDLLIEELTVYENLLFNAKLSLANLKKSEIIRRVNKLLEDLDLLYVKDHQVGNPLNNFISGGQRKRLNIALELIREPAILLIDEPTTGLSSSDSKHIISLLKNQTRTGKLVIATIHQPSSDIFRILNKIWVLDKNGYPVYTGNPVEGIEYLKKISTQVDVVETECPVCGNFSPDQILEMIEARQVNDEGVLTKQRKITPRQWYGHYLEKIESKLHLPKRKEKLPHSSLKIPGDFKQFFILSIRNLSAKLGNKQYWVINLLEAPVLAVILAFFLKNMSENQYVFQDNKNIPVYIFISVIVALFLGLTVSAEEIFRDRKTLERESYLFLSRPAYINSKIVLLFALSAIQTLSFLLMANYILGIKHMTFSYWLVLFTVSAFGNMLGLVLSSSLDSVVAIYILVPLIMVPEILFSGALISYDDLNNKLTNKKYTPIIGDLMATRWAFEALAVYQFKNNRYEKPFFEPEKQISNNAYRISFLIPEIRNKAAYIYQNFRLDSSVQKVSYDLSLIRNQFNRLVKYQGVPPFEHQRKLLPHLLTIDILDDLNGYLNFLQGYFIDQRNLASARKEEILDSLSSGYGKSGLLTLRQDYFNNSLSDLVLNHKHIRKVIEYKGEFIQKKDPVFMFPENAWGRAQLYSSSKLLNKRHFDVFTFNLFILWVSIIFLYTILVFDILRKIISSLRI